MDIIGVIFGRYFIELFGASLRFSFGFIRAKLFGAKYKRFENYWNSKKGNSYDKMETETANRITGFLFIVAIAYLIFLFL